MDNSLKYSNDMYVSTTMTSKEVEVRRGGGEVYRFISGLVTLAAGEYLTMSGMTPPVGAVKVTVNADLIYERL